MMARAHFDAHITGPNDDIVVGDALDIEISVGVVETHHDVALEWKVGWTASGKTTNTTIVVRGVERIARIDADDDKTWTIAFTVPDDGPVSYQGRLLEVQWFLQASLDIPWAIDPKSSFVFEVGPRKKRPRKRRKKK
jgi:sporulation-control protein spo0M